MNFGPLRDPVKSCHTLKKKDATLIELYFEKINLLIYYNSWKIYNLLKSIEAAREGVL